MTDIRTIKTVRAIRTAFINMIIEKNNVFFSIKDIADRAKINRKTFYLHFECIEDLYNDLENITEEKLLEILEKNNFFSNKLSLEIFLKSILELINSNYPLYQKLLIQDNYKFLFRNVKNKVKKQIFSELNIDASLKNELLFEYVSSGLMKMFRVWANEKDKMSEEELLKTAYQIMQFGIEGISKNQI